MAPKFKCLALICRIHEYCATSGSQLVDVAEHYDVLQLATAPDLKCHHCKYPLTCVASESLMAMLPGLPLPTVTPEQRKLIEDVRERKPEAPQIVAPAEADADAAGAQQVSMWVPVAAAFVVVGLAAVSRSYRALVAPRTKSEGVGPQVSPSATGGRRGSPLTFLAAPTAKTCPINPSRASVCRRLR